MGQTYRLAPDGPFYSTSFPIIPFEHFKAHINHYPGGPGTPTDSPATLIFEEFGSNTNPRVLLNLESGLNGVKAKVGAPTLEREAN
jgi:hypothetical protein